MGIRNKRPDLNGLLVINKPLTWTSADVCRLIRRKTGGAKVGHGGTLDPLATGVLVVCLGRATKTISKIMQASKRYEAVVDLSAFSTTDDAEGERTELPAPSPVPTHKQIRIILDDLTGEIMQRPPAYSAIKVDGKRAYKLARSGETVELQARQIRIDSIEILAYDWPTLAIDIRCGKGTYIRSIARDLGEALGTGGMLTGLSRTEIGRFTLETAVDPETLPDEFTPDDLHEMI